MNRLAGLCFLVLVTSTGCTKSSPPSGESQPSRPAPVAGITLRIAYGSEKKTWFEEQAKAFMASGAKTRGGKPIQIDAKPSGSGEAVQAILAGTLRPHVVSPASGAYITLLNAAWLSTAG